jgi:preprotein translocase subunit SecG
VKTSTGGEIDTTLDRQVAPADPLAGVAAPAPAASSAPAPVQSAPAQDPNDPLSGLTE